MKTLQMSQSLKGFSQLPPNLTLFFSDVSFPLNVEIFAVKPL